MASEHLQNLNINWIVSSSLQDTINRNLNFLFWLSLPFSHDPAFVSMFLWTAHFAKDRFLVKAKLFLITTKKEKLQEDKGLKEYRALEKRNS